MKNLLLLMVFAMTLGTTYAKRAVEAFNLKGKKPLPVFLNRSQFTTPHLVISQNYGFYPGSSMGVNDVLTYNTPTVVNGNTVMSLTNTDSYGNDMTITWSVVGSTLNWSVNVIPGSGLNVGLHRFWMYDYSSPNFDTYADDDYEDPTGDGYGNVTWYASGSIDLTTTSNPIDFSFEYLTTDPNNNDYTFTKCIGQFVF